MQGGEVRGTQGRGMLADELLAAVQEGEAEVVLSLIKKGSDVNKKYEQNKTPLIIATELNNLDIVKILIDAEVAEVKADVDAETEDRWTALMVAAHEGFQNIVEALIEATDVKKELPDGRSALHLAAQKGNIAVVKWLIKAKAEVDAQTKTGWTPLMIAAQKGHGGIVQVLTEESADVKKSLKDGRTVLHIAAEENYVDVVNKLIKAKEIEVDAQTETLWTPLMIAAQKGLGDIVDALIEAGAGINRTLRHRRTALHLAAENGNVAVVKQLVAKGAEVYTKTQWIHLIIEACQGHDENVKTHIKDIGLKKKLPDGRTILHIGAESGHTKVVSTLVEAGADVDVQTEAGWTPLMVAAQKNLENVAEVLLTKADVNKTDIAGRTALHLARNANIANKLIEAGADLNIQMDSGWMDGWTPLMFMIDRGLESVAVIAINQNADVTKKLKDGRTTLHLAAYNENINLVNRLITAGAEVDAQTEDGWTTLMIAAQKGLEDIVEALIKASMDVNKELADGRTALYLAACEGHDDVVKALLEAGAEVDAETEAGWTPLMIAACQGHDKIVDILIEDKADFDKKLSDGRTILHFAAENGHDDVVEKLVKAEAKVDAETNTGRNSLMVAVENGHIAVVQWTNYSWG